MATLLVALSVLVRSGWGGEVGRRRERRGGAWQAGDLSTHLHYSASPSASDSIRGPFISPASTTASLVDAHKAVGQLKHVVAQADDHKLRVLGAVLDVVAHDGHVLEVWGKGAGSGGCEAVPAQR